MQSSTRTSSSSTSSRRRYQAGAGLHRVKNGIAATTTDHTYNENSDTRGKSPRSLSNNQSKSLDSLFLDLTLGAGAFGFCFDPRDCSYGANTRTTREAADTEEEIRFDFAQQPPRLQQLPSKQQGEWLCDPSNYTLSENIEGYPDRRSPSSSSLLLTSTTTAGCVSTTFLHNAIKISSISTSVSKDPVRTKPNASRPPATTSPMNGKETMLRVVDVIPVGRCRKSGSTCGATSTTHSASQPSHGHSTNRHYERPISGIPFDLTERPPPVGRCTPLDPCDLDQIEMVWGRVLLVEGNRPDHDLGSILGSGYSIASLPKRRSRSFLSLMRKR